MASLSRATVNVNSEAETPFTLRVMPGSAVLMLFVELSTTIGVPPAPICTLALDAAVTRLSGPVKDSPVPPVRLVSIWIAPAVPGVLLVISSR